MTWLSSIFDLIALLNAMALLSILDTYPRKQDRWAITVTSRLSLLLSDTNIHRVFPITTQMVILKIIDKDS